MAKVKFPMKVLKPIQDYLVDKEKKLQKKKQELEKEDPFSDPDRLKDNAATDADAAEQFGHDRVEAMRKEVDKALIRVRKSLTRIKLGKYGVCEECAEMIDTDRLAIDPTAAYCVKCANNQAKKNSK